MTAIHTRLTLCRPKVALIVDTSLASGRDVLRGIGDYVQQHEPWSIFHGPRGLEDPAPQWLHDWDGDGIIVRMQNREIALTIKEAGIPTVDVLGMVPEANLPLVHVDDRAVSRLTAEHLLERGFRHFGYCGLLDVPWSDRRRNAFREAIEESGYECAVHGLSSYIRGSRDWAKVEQQLVQWVSSLPKPVGLMACNDPRGQLLLEACRQGGVVVPEEAAVVGVDNDEPLCMIADPPLSSVSPNHDSVGFEAAALLDKMMSGGEPPKSPILVTPQGIVTRVSSDVSAIVDLEVASIVRFVREHACNGINIHDVVRYSGFSRSTLLRKISKVLGRTLHEEIMRIRLNHVRELLSETNLSIEAISSKSGFNHRQYLGKVFKAEFGETLVEYRKKFHK